MTIKTFCNIMKGNDKHLKKITLMQISNNRFYLDPVLDKLEESLVDEGRFLDSPELDAMLPTWAVIELCNIILKTKLKTLINNWSNWNCNFCKDWIAIELAKIDWLRFKMAWSTFHSYLINTCLNLWEIEYVRYLLLFS